MTDRPKYSPEELSLAYELRHTWTGWPAGDAQFPRLSRNWLEQLASQWEGDGIRLLEWQWQRDQVQLTCSTRPVVSPVLLAQRLKGRLDHLLRTCGCQTSMSRKVGVTSVGHNRRIDVEHYIDRQLEHHRYPPDMKDRLRPLIVIDPSVDLTRPTATRRGRYWYNLHLVLETDGPIRNLSTLAAFRDRCFSIARKHEYQISRLAVILEHLHMAMRGNILHSPQDVGLKFLNNLAHIHGRCWKPGFYVGTFGEYTMALTRHPRE